MAYKTCDWCGRSYKPMFSADRDAGNAFADAMGLGIGVKAIGGIARLAGKRNFCSKQCKLAYENSKNGGNSSNMFLLFLASLRPSSIMPSASTLSTSAKTGPSTIIEVISLRRSSNFLFSREIMLGLVVTPEMAPIS